MRIDASGVRSSWAASAVNRRISSKDRCSRAIMSLNVFARRPSSSLEFGACSRRSSRVEVISFAVAAIRSTGARALRASQYPPPRAPATTGGTVKSSTTRSSLNACSLGASDTATWTTSGFAGPETIRRPAAPAPGRPV